LALAVLGDTIGANLLMVGIALQRGLLPVSVAALERAIVLNGVAVSLNLKALRLGRLFAIDPARALELTQKSPSGPPSFNEDVELRAAHLTAYQDAALAERYRRLLDRVSAREAEVVGQSGPLARAAARAYAKLLAYKDEYEVARLLTRPALQQEMAQVFAAGGRGSFNLAPPFLAGRGINGRPRKREFGPWLRPALQVLARGRRLRGTVFDLFGYTAERRAERALIAQYEQLVARVLTALTAANHHAGVELLSLAEEVRGFGPVKEAAMLRYHDRAQSLEQAFRAARGNPANA
jgi:indolepyruvate ferredoxin oxidoreductase